MGESGLLSESRLLDESKLLVYSEPGIRTNPVIQTGPVIQTDPVVRVDLIYLRPQFLLFYTKAQNGNFEKFRDCFFLSTDTVIAAAAGQKITSYGIMSMN